jgi:hypothetical protein
LFLRPLNSAAAVYGSCFTYLFYVFSMYLVVVV